MKLIQTKLPGCVVKKLAPVVMARLQKRNRRNYGATKEHQ